MRLPVQTLIKAFVYFVKKLWLPEFVKKFLVKVGNIVLKRKSRIWISETGLSINVPYLHWKILVTDQYEPEIWELSRLFATKDRDILDVGSNAGIFALRWSLLGRYVYAFEPTMKYYSMLLQNIKRNDLTNIFPLKVAAFSSGGIAYIDINESEPGSHSLTKENAVGSEKILKIKIDSLHLTNVGFVKIDVEGGELEVLRGMMSTIERNEPSILLEFDRLHLKETAEEIIGCLESVSYHCLFIGGSHNARVFSRNGRSFLNPGHLLAVKEKSMFEQAQDVLVAKLGYRDQTE